MIKKKAFFISFLFLISCNFQNINLSTENTIKTSNSIEKDFSVDLDKFYVMKFKFSFESQNFTTKADQCNYISKKIDISIKSNEKKLADTTLFEYDGLEYQVFVPKDLEKVNTVLALNENNKTVQVKSFDFEPAKSKDSSYQIYVDNKNTISIKDSISNSPIIESTNQTNYNNTKLNVSVNVKETNKITSKPIKEAYIPTSTEIPKEVKPAFSTNNEVLFKQGSKPTVSPDGNKIVYFDNFDMYISNISGTNTKVLKSDVRWSKASISPDGKVAFIDEKNNLRGIYTINQDGSDLKRIVADNSIDLTSLSWSPDGKKIAFSKVKNAQSDIFTVDADGNNEQNITNDVHIDIAPSYSPSGEYISYISQRKIENPTTTKTYNNDIYIMNADGSNKFNLTGTDKKIDIIDRPSEPSWSNDSNLILFSSTTKDSNTSNIYITNFHTLYLTKLTNIGNESSPFMIPFDKKIGYVRTGKIYFSNFSN